MVRLILGTGAFMWPETRLTAASLGIFCIGIFASAFIPFLARVFYSFQDTKTPVIISLLSMTLNIALCFLLTFLLGFPNLFQEIIIRALKLQEISNIAVLGLPMALSISAIFQFFLLLYYLKKKLSDIKIREICFSLKKTIIASMLMAITSFLSLRLVAGIIETDTFFNLLIQASVSAAAGGLVFWQTLRLLKSEELEIIKSSIIARLKRFNGKHS
jgi:putative peptidoglycan lipid II flippase